MLPACLVFFFAVSALAQDVHRSPGVIECEAAFALGLPALVSARTRWQRDSHDESAKPRRVTASWVAPPAPKPLTQKIKAIYRRFWNDAYKGIDKMREDKLGLLTDTTYLRQKAGEPYRAEIHQHIAAPTDVGLDLVLQLAALDEKKLAKGALKKIERAVEVLDKLPRDPKTNLFYRKYRTDYYADTKGALDTDAGTDRHFAGVDDRDLSAIDNLHLALGLWTVEEKFAGTATGRKAKALRESMNFTPFLDHARAETGANDADIGGNLKYLPPDSIVESDPDRIGPQHRRDDYRFHFGSEARSLYVLGYALGLFHGTSDADLELALARVPVETKIINGKPVVLGFDGGIFQSLLPSLLAPEGQLSRLLSQSSETVAGYMIDKGPLVTLADGTSLQMPGAYSASIKNVYEKPDGPMEIEYTGQAGLPDFRVSYNPNDPEGHTGLTLHAIFLAASQHPEKYAALLEKLKTVEYRGEKAYLPDFGFVDSFRVETVNGKQILVPNSAANCLDQLMIGLSNAKILAADGNTPTMRALLKNKKVLARLTSAYRIMDQRQLVADQNMKRRDSIERRPSKRRSERLLQPRPRNRVTP